MKKTIFTVAIFIFSFQLIAFCQTDTSVLRSATAKLKILLTDHIIEKAYLHFDKPNPYYIAGDIIYFRAYVTMGELHEPSTISRILHVDLINKDDVLMQSIKLQLNSGMGWGDFVLPDTLQSGNYRIRAYTEWMRNYKETYFFDQPIAVISTNSVDGAIGTIKQKSSPNLQIFPEGGNLVSGIHSKVAFKAVGADGLGITFKGIVVDNDSKEIGEITSGRLGMGITDFTPEEGKTYKAKVTFSDGSQNTVDLPAVEPKGITLSVNTDDTATVSIRIKANAAYYKENKDKELNLIIYWAGTVRTAKIKLSNATLGLDLPASTFRTGVLQVTLLSQTGEPLNERLAFIQNQDLLKLSVAANKSSFAKGENVQLNINAKNMDGNAVTGFFSVSVTDESKLLVDENNENTILSYLLLSSDLKGYIEKPNYYFAHITKDTRADLDALMLTQGYRRFVWKQLINNNYPPVAYQPEKSLEISGRLEDLHNKPTANTTVSLLPMAGGMPLSNVTDDKGMFHFPDLNFTDTAHFLLRVNNKKMQNATRIIYFNDTLKAPVTPADQLSAAQKINTDIIRTFKNNAAKQDNPANYNESKVMISEAGKMKIKNKEDKYSTLSLTGAGNADQVLHNADLGHGPLIINLNGLLREIKFVNDVPYFQTSFSQTLNRKGEVIPPMLVVVDGVKHGDLSTLLSEDVETVEVLKNENEGIYGVEGVGGVLVITTKQGNGESTKNLVSTTGVLPVSPIGFYKAKEFYIPKYDNTNLTDKQLQLHPTVFWKPDITTDINGNASLSYLNSGETGTYNVIVEGIDSKGNLGRQVYRYEVK